MNLIWWIRNLWLCNLQEAAEGMGGDDDQSDHEDRDDHQSEHSDQDQVDNEGGRKIKTKLAT